MNLNNYTIDEIEQFRRRNNIQVGVNVYVVFWGRIVNYATLPFGSFNSKIRKEYETLYKFSEKVIFTQGLIKKDMSNII